MAVFSLQDGVVTAASATLAGGSSYEVRAHYAGDGIYAPSDSNPVTVTVAPEPSKTLITIPIFDSVTGQETINVPTSIAYGVPIVGRVDVGNSKAAVTLPPQPVCAPLSCPSGKVALLDSRNGATGTPLGFSGGLSLNSEGYMETNSVNLLGGVPDFPPCIVATTATVPVRNLILSL